MFQNYCLFLVLSSLPWKADHGFSRKVGLAGLCTAIAGRKGDDYFLFLNIKKKKPQLVLNLCFLFLSGYESCPRPQIWPREVFFKLLGRAFRSESQTHFPTCRLPKDKMPPGPWSRSVECIQSHDVGDSCHGAQNSLCYFDQAPYLLLSQYPHWTNKDSHVSILPLFFCLKFTKLNKMLLHQWKCFELLGRKSRAMAKSVVVYQNFHCQKAI